MTESRSDYQPSDGKADPSHNFYIIAIPLQDKTKTALDYHQIPIDLTGDPNKQPLVDVAKFGIVTRSAYVQANAPYYRSFAAAHECVYVREEVAIRLSRVNDKLRSYSAELVALDGFRSIDLQRELWNHFINQGKKVLTNPQEEDLIRFAGSFCSNPSHFDDNDFTTWPIHTTGGSIDLTVQSVVTKQELFMGSIFDDGDEVSSTRYFEDDALSSDSALEARRNRRLLFHAMASEGFVNYSHEWWHFDYGTQMWIMNAGLDGPAFFGHTKLECPPGKQSPCQTEQHTSDLVRE